MSVAGNLAMLGYMFIAERDVESSEKYLNIRSFTETQLQPDAFLKGSNAHTSIDESEPPAEGWQRVDPKRLARLSQGSVLSSSSFILSHEICEILEINDIDHEAFQRTSARLFTKVLDAEASRVKIVREGEGIAYFSIPPLSDVVDDFVEEWEDEMTAIFSPKIIEIIGNVYSQQLNELQTRERQLSIYQNGQGYNINISQVEDGNTLRSTSFALGINGVGESTLDRYLHIEDVANVIQPFLERHVNGVD